MENIKNKIKKLLALSGNNDSDHESYAALRKAQELMAQYKLSMSDISEEEVKKQECIKKRTPFHYGTRSSDSYMSRLSDIISDNFCCVSYLSTLSGTQTRYICFMGLEEDVDICIEAMHLANMYIIKGYNRVYKHLCKKYNLSYIPAKKFNPLKEGYVKGYLAGLKEALRSQREENQEWGLVLVAPQEAKDYISSLSSLSSRTIDYSDAFYNEGYDDGKQFHLNDKIDTAEEKRKIE